MAPNRKSIITVFAPPVDTHPLVQAKYQYQPFISTPSTATLTKETPVSAEPTIIRSNISVEESDNYWDWSTCDDEKEEEASSADLFSASRIEENVVKESLSLRCSETPIIRATTTAPAADYWEERVQAYVVRSRAANQDGSEKTGYWDWPEESQVNAVKKIIAFILKEEMVRRQVSTEQVKNAANYVTTTCSDAAWNWETTDNNSTVSPSCEIKDSYWDWDSPASVMQVIGSSAAKQ